MKDSKRGLPESGLSADLKARFGLAGLGIRSYGPLEIIGQALEAADTINHYVNCRPGPNGKPRVEDMREHVKKGRERLISEYGRKIGGLTFPYDGKRYGTVPLLSVRLHGHPIKKVSDARKYL